MKNQKHFLHRIVLQIQYSAMQFFRYTSYCWAFTTVVIIDLDLKIFNINEEITIITFSSECCSIGTINILTFITIFHYISCTKQAIF